MKTITLIALCVACALGTPHRSKRADGATDLLQKGEETLNALTEQVKNFDPSKLFEETTPFSDDEKTQLEEMRATNFFNFNDTDLARIFEVLKRYRGMEVDTKNAFEGLMGEQRTITSDLLEKLPLVLFTIVTPENMMKIKNKLTSSQKGNICRKALNMDSRAFTRIAKMFKCQDNFGKDAPEMDKQQASSLIEAFKEANGEASTWSADVWMNAIPFLRGLDSDDIKRMPASIVKENLDSLGEAIGDNEEVVKHIRESLGGLDKITGEQLEKMPIDKLPISDIRKIPPQAMKDAVSKIRDGRKKMTKAKQREVSKQLKEAFNVTGNNPIPDDMTAADIATIIQFNPNDRNILNKIPMELLENVTSQMSEVELEEDEKIGLVEKLRKTALKNFNSWDSNKVKSMKNFIGGLANQEFKDIPENNIKAVLNEGEFSDVDLPKSMARELVKMSTGVNTPLNKASIQKLGANTRALAADDVKNMADADLMDSDVLTILSTQREKLSRATKKQIMEKVQSSADPKGNLLKLGGLIKEAPLELIKQLTADELMTQVTTEPCSVDCEGAACEVLYKKAIESIGRPDIKNPEFNVENANKLCNIMCGIPLADIKSLPEDSKLSSLINVFNERKCLNQKQTKLLASKELSYLNFDNAAPSLTREDVENMGGHTLKYLSDAELKKIPAAVCKDVVRELGKVDLSDVPRKEMVMIAKYAVETCFQKVTGSLSDEELLLLGNLVCVLPKDRIAELASATAVEDLTAMIDSCPEIPREELKALKDKFVSTQGLTDFSTVDDSILALGARLLAYDCEANGDALQQIPDSVMAAGITDFVESVEKGMENEEMRKENGNENDIPNAERSLTMSDNKCMILKGVNARIAERTAEAAAASQNVRRKRSTGTVTCNDIKMMGNLASALTASHINGLSNTDFSDCASYLGEVNDWSDAQKTALVTKAKAAWGAVDTWTENNVLDMGSIGLGLTAAEITSLTFSVDSLATLGTISGWTTEQLSSGFTKWFGNRNHNTLTRVELSSIGHFACGIQHTNIGTIPADTYKFAAKDVGSADMCDSNQLTAYATLAKTSYGNTVANWDSSTVNEVGAVIGGLSASEIGTLAEQQLSAIDPTVISKLPGSALSGLTTTQIAYLSPAQAKSITDTQKANLSEDQKKAISKIAGVATDDDDDNAAPDSMKNMSAIFVGIMVLMAMTYTKVLF
ncbi:hypothetical protein SNE40_001005 [Patella caerulea]|uniref:Uncharacterized protein n=1 Tax=Patella caerulea TaxID=87958 RepID=A0AAN8KD64_PATCE